MRPSSPHHLVTPAVRGRFAPARFPAKISAFIACEWAAFPRMSVRTISEGVWDGFGVKSTACATVSKRNRRFEALLVNHSTCLALRTLPRDPRCRSALSKSPAVIQKHHNRRGFQ